MAETVYQDVSSVLYPEPEDDTGEAMPKGDVVNLDAMVPREDFLASIGTDPSVAGQKGKFEISLTDLTPGEIFFATLRKPDFQRETAAWSPETVRDFIASFVHKELVPSVICWQSAARLSFVIDGAHRLSAIIAWILDDYGDKESSLSFYNQHIAPKQKKIAQETRQLIDGTVGAYRDLKVEAQRPGTYPRLSERARALGHATIPLLWVQDADPAKAEQAFTTINRKAVQIDPTELQILQARFRPNAVASRAIVRKASGHKYWSSFSDQGVREVEALAADIYDGLYSPPLDPPVRTMDLPVAGHGYGSQTLPLIFDLVNIATEAPVVDASKAKGAVVVQHQAIDEAATLKVLRQTRALTWMLTGTHSSCLGLHPAIYFYSASGRHQPTAVLAIADLMKRLDKEARLLQFCEVRSQFEDFLKGHKTFVNQMVTRFGSMAKGYKQLREYFEFVLGLIFDGYDADEIVGQLKDHDIYQKLVKERQVSTQQTKAFSQDLKSALFLKKHLENTVNCAWCRAAMDGKAMQLDHVLDKKDGGLGNEDNAAWAHPYCNSTYKDYYIKQKGGAS